MMKMKRVLLALLVVLAFSATLSAAEDQPTVRRGFLGWRWPWWRSVSGAPVPPPDPKIGKCLQAFQGAAVCLHPPVGKDCCAALKTVQSDCADMKFGHGFLDSVLEKSCSDGAPAQPVP